MTNEILREALDHSYFRRREQQERAAARKAAHSRAREAHQEMAELYHDLAAEPVEPQPVAITPAPNASARAA